jgi:hypothetical protein
LEDLEEDELLFLDPDEEDEDLVELDRLFDDPPEYLDPDDLCFEELPDL